MNDTVQNLAPVADLAEQMTWAISLLPRKRILLLDDNPAIRQVLLRLLADEDYNVSPAADDAEALKCAATSKFDLILLDLNLPDEKGRKAFEQIKAANPQIPVIVITARPDQFASALAGGAGVLLEKPMDFVKLFDTIHELLDGPPEHPLEELPHGLQPMVAREWATAKEKSTE